jgi:HEAT repeat protein
MSRSVLLLIFWCAAGAVCVTLGVIIVVRVSTAIVRWRVARYQSVVRDHLTAFVVGVRDDPPPPPRDRFEQRVLRRDLVAFLPSVKGEAAARVAEVFAASGLVEVAHRDLDARNSLTRIRAADVLGALRVIAAEPWLIARLHHHDPLLRLACARALAELGAVDELPAIIAALEEVGADPGDVVEVMLAFGPRGVPFLTELLVAGSPTERRLAAVALGHVASRHARPVLSRTLEDPDDELVADAARALGQLGDVRATAALIALLRDRRPWFVRVAAAAALGALEDPAAVPALVEELDAEEWDLRNAAARSLVALDPDGLDGVMTAMDTVSDRGVAHFAGLVDVAGRMESIVRRASGGDSACDRFVRRACAAGVRARLDELAAGSLEVGRYAAAVLAAELAT